MESCKHTNFDANVDVNRLEDVQRFSADVRISCVDCGVPMRFIGLPAGVDLNGASVSIDGTEGRFAIAPKGEVISELEGTASGFNIRKECQMEERMMKWFAYEHLPEHLKSVSCEFANLATRISTSIDPGPERTVALRKLLEAKDAAVRAKLNPGG